MKLDLAFLVQDAQEEEQQSSQTRYGIKEFGVDTAMKDNSLLGLAFPAVASVGSTPPCPSDALPPPPAQELGVSVGSTRSASIPLPSSHIERTQSEIQLDLDEAAAEQREIGMFYRMVNGIRERQKQLAAANPPPHYHGAPIAPEELAGRSSFVPPGAQDYLVPYPPQQHQQNWQPPLPTSPVREAVDPADGWSITGFDAPEGHPEQAQAREDGGGEDLGIFDIEL